MKQLILSVFALTSFSLGAHPASDVSIPWMRMAAGGTGHSVLESRSILEQIRGAGSFDRLLVAMETTGLLGTLAEAGPFTLFAPTDRAFAALPEATLVELAKPSNKGTLASILNYHVVSGSVMTKGALRLGQLDTLNGQRIQIEGDAGAGAIHVGRARLVSTDISCSNGVIHVLDCVLMPNTADLVKTIAARGTYRSFAAAIKAGGLMDTLRGQGPYTVFLPTDEAFGALPEGTLRELLEPAGKERLSKILKLHVVRGRLFADQALRSGAIRSLLGTRLEIRKQGDEILVGGGKLVEADVQASNGVIQVIDTVLLPSN